MAFTHDISHHTIHVKRNVGLLPACWIYAALLTLASDSEISVNNRMMEAEISKVVAKHLGETGERLRDSEQAFWLWMEGR